MKPRPEIPAPRRYTLGVVLSLVLHGIPAFPWGIFGLGFDMDIEMPEFDLTAIELTEIDPNQMFGEEGEPEESEPIAPVPEAVPPPPELTPEGGDVPEEPPPPEEPKPKPFGEKKAKLDKVGPPNAIAFAFLAARKASKLQHATQLVDLMAALPDFIYIVDGGGFNVLRDFDYLVIASPNPRAINATMVTVQYRLSRAELKAGLDRAAGVAGERIKWEEKSGVLYGDPVPLEEGKRDWDPRVFVFLGKNTAVYVRKEFLPAILSVHGDGDDDDSSAAEPPKSMAEFVANMTRLRRVAQREPNAVVIAAIKDIRSKVRRAKFTVPDALELMIEAADEPEVVIKLDVVSPDDAKQLIKEWNEELPTLIDKVPFVFRGLVRGIYEGIEVERSRQQVTLRSEFSARQAQLLLDLGTKGTRQIAERNKQAAAMDERKRQREALWEARKGGRLTPSEALEKLRAAEEAKAGDGDAPDEPLEGKLPKKPPPGVRPADPAPAETDGG